MTHHVKLPERQECSELVGAKQKRHRVRKLVFGEDVKKKPAKRKAACSLPCAEITCVWCVCTIFGVLKHLSLFCLHICMCTSVCLLLIESIGGCELIYNCSSRWLWAAIWALGPESGASARTAGAQKLSRLSMLFFCLLIFFSP